MMRRSKIVATLGPATASLQAVRELLDAGMNVARLNFSHGDHTSLLDKIKLVRAVSEETGTPITILQDLQGPKLRTGVLPKGRTLPLSAGQTVTLVADGSPMEKGNIEVTYERLGEEVSAGDRILIDDGSLELKVVASDGRKVEAEVIVGGELGSRKGINVPGVTLSASSLTAKDHHDLDFGLKHQVDAIALSFVRRASDIVDLREFIQSIQPGQRVPLIIAKLERPEAIENLEEILEVSDGVMVARGDLGVEVSPEKVPSLQKRIIREAMARQRFVITATQMLESMIANPRPTRAEASDVANAVFDGSDALMLSGETAVGKFPTRTLSTMHRIIEDAEQHAVEWGQQVKFTSQTVDDAVATTKAARALAHDRQVAGLAVFTRSGRSARLLSSVRPDVPILAFTPEPRTYHQLAMAWGVIPHLVEMANSVEEMISHVRKACLASGIVAAGEQVVMVASLPVGAMGPPNFTMLHTIA